MAQDKRIRISVDTSPLREMRQGVEDVNRSVRELSNNTSNVRIDSSRENLEQDNNALQRQIDFINQRNSLNQIPQDKKQPSIEDERVVREKLRENVQDINRLTEQRKGEDDPTKYNELTESINRLIRENDRLHDVLLQLTQQKVQRDKDTTTIQQPQQKRDTESRISFERERTDLSKVEQRIKENKEDITELRNRLKSIDQSTPFGNQETTKIKEEIQRLTQDNKKLQSILDREERKDGRQEREKQVTTPISNIHIENLLKQILQNTSEINTLLGKNERRKNTTDAGITSSVQNGVIHEQRNRSDNSINSNDSSVRNRDRDRGLSNLGRLGTGTTSVLVQGAVDAIGRYAMAKNEYEGAAGLFGAAGSSLGGIVSSVGNALGPIGGAIGGILGGALSGVSQLLASKWMMEIEALGNAERNSLIYTQTTGQTTGQTLNQGFREGSFAARDLGLDVGEYMQRRGQLLRASGGRIIGATEQDQTGIREANSLLSVQRAYGLSEGSVTGLLGALRFARPGSTDYGSSSNSPSAIIRMFENTMKELKVPFSEIAATMDESLNTFNQTTKSILDKAGEFDAGKIATILSAVRVATDMEGRQLERVQQAITGQNVSQDTVTQAILLRAARETHPEAETYIELKAVIDKMAEDFDLQSRFLEMLQNLSGGNQGQLQSILKQVWPGLSNQDIVDLSKGTKNLNTILDELHAGIRPEVTKGYEEQFQYDTSIARKTVGTIEAANAERANERIGQGGEAIERLNSINKVVDEILTFLQDRFKKEDQDDSIEQKIKKALPTVPGMHSPYAQVDLYKFIKDLLKGNAR